MNLREKKKVRRAIWFLVTDESKGGDFLAGVEILLKLVGHNTATLESLKNLKVVSVKTALEKKESLGYDPEEESYKKERDAYEI
jgi:hypothetical protein